MKKIIEITGVVDGLQGNRADPHFFTRSMIRAREIGYCPDMHYLVQRIVVHEAREIATAMKEFSEVLCVMHWFESEAGDEIFDPPGSGTTRSHRHNDIFRRMVKLGK